MRAIFAWIIGIVVALALAFGLYWHGASQGWWGKERDAGIAMPGPLPPEVLAVRAPPPEAAGDAGLILYGDLHVHTTYSTDAFMWALPMNGGRGVHPVSEACDFARFCSGIDFWALTDHAEAATPERWTKTKEALRQCQAVSGGEANPQLITFAGFEWTQVGRLPQDHFGHKNVLFRDLADESIAARPIAAGGVTTQTLRTQAQGLPPLLALREWQDRQHYWDFNRFLRNIQKVPSCDPSKPSNELPANCFEEAPTPGELMARLEAQKLDPLVIPHGSSWGFYTPPGTSWDKSLDPKERPEKFTLIEVFSGHGNSEEFRPWLDVALAPDGQSGVCPPVTDTYTPPCQRAGQIIEERCLKSGAAAEDCAKRAADARTNAANMGVAYHLSVPGTTPEDWLDSGQCTDCFVPPFHHRPRNSVQYGLAISRFDETPENPGRFTWGFIASSDNHRARPGTGYKAVDRRLQTESSGPRDQDMRALIIPPTGEPAAVSRMIPQEELLTMSGFALTELERQSAFFTTGGLAAVHAADRSRGGVWDGLQRRETFGTSGPRMALWFDLVDPKAKTKAPMGSQVAQKAPPVFEVRALGAFKQKPGCPDFTAAGADAERIKGLCGGECYNPTSERMKITRLEIVRIRPQRVKDEMVETLIQDPFLTIPCNDQGGGCTARFTDPAYVKEKRDTLYYVRAIQEPEPMINAKPIDCTKRDANGKCLEVKPLCYGDWRSGDSNCTAPAEHRAWSSPIYLSPQ
jgi:hypothetical protein